MIYRLGTPQDHLIATESYSPPHLVYNCAPQWTPTGPLHFVVPPVNMLVQRQLRNLSVPIPGFWTIPRET